MCALGVDTIQKRGWLKVVELFALKNEPFFIILYDLWPFYLFELSQRVHDFKMMY